MPAPVTFFAREDSGSANNPALNLTTDPAIQLTLVAETSTGGAGDLWLDQPTGGGVDPDTQVEIDGNSYEFTFEFVGTMPTLAADGAQQVPDQFEGDQTVVITIHDYPSTGTDTRFMFLPQSGATEAEMNDFGNGAIDVQNVDNTPPATPVCFLEGTPIATPCGERAVETLRTGDLVLTRDHGPQPVRWVGRSSFRWPGADAAALPILIRAGALGHGVPRADLVVSPQHRMLLAGPSVRRCFGAAEVLAPAKGLTGLPGVRRMAGKRQAVYYHLLLDRHEVLTAAGAPTESLYPGPMALESLTPAQRAEIHALMPALRRDERAGRRPVPARRLLSRKEAVQVARAFADVAPRDLQVA